MKKKKTLENIMEITSLFEFHNALGKFKECNEPVSYFDQLKSSIENWAAEFEEHFDEDTMDYLNEIEVFATRKFAEMGWLLDEDQTKEKETAAGSDFVILTVVSESKYGSDLMTSLHASSKEAEKEAERLKSEYEKAFDTTYFNYQISVFSTSELEAVMERKALDDAPLPLTVGLLRSLAAGKNIPALEIFLDGRPDDQILNLLNREDYFSTRLWEREYVEERLEHKGYPVSEENVTAVLNCQGVDYFGECIDLDWEFIDDVIEDCACHYNSFLLLNQLKEKWLMLESLYDTTIADSIAEDYMNRKLLDKCCRNEHELEEYLFSMNSYLRSKIDTEVYEEWEYEYSLYTQKKYGKKFYNEIENPILIDNILEKVRRIMPVKGDGAFALSIYDLNNELIYFDSEEELSDFAQRYSILPATAYRQVGAVLEELWSI